MKITATISTITAAVGLLLSSCSGNSGTTIPQPGTDGVTLRLLQPGFTATRIVDADNLAVEQTINNITIFLTEPASPSIIYRYIDVGFSTVGDYRLVTLPDSPADLQTKDIYVIANQPGSDLTAITSILQLNEVSTPVVTKSDYLDPAAGFCMYGKLQGFDFTSGETADVYVRRTCAKLRINLTFPDEPQLSTDNSYLFANVANHTFVRNEGLNPILITADYFNFAAELPLTDDGNDTYTDITYVYEATQGPVLYLYTHIGGSATAQEFSAPLPLPMRNHLYDLDIRVYEDVSSATRTTTTDSYVMETTVRTYTPDGEHVSTTTYNDRHR